MADCEMFPGSAWRFLENIEAPRGNAGPSKILHPGWISPERKTSTQKLFLLVLPVKVRSRVGEEAWAKFKAQPFSRLSGFGEGSPTHSG